MRRVDELLCSSAFGGGNQRRSTIAIYSAQTVVCSCRHRGHGSDNDLRALTSLVESLRAGEITIHNFSPNLPYPLGFGVGGTSPYQGTHFLVMLLKPANNL